ncbi:SRPBCC family protein [Cellulomonas dongxiuzhuiae]|uniref:SRPBCC family protein n=1 Tax=Cellulomonas dongxiuzhuiae TaxID=2819979 RepID=A0ABX8GKZ5_9CELL|nr:SRPBCC family protein [Cellulomonas dongxiuzhuiae]MBO3096384.1 SRPBCC family protein [Cellulomonas dongxiuzhuiae]QWC16794.1 SRPBCC family protein [Cellulomonas dongxiuzhuiae]
MTPARPAGADPVTGPGTASVTRALPVPADVAWRALTDARRHTAWVPMTRVRTDGPPRLGTRVVAVSGPGARRGWPGLVDRMVVTRYVPPGDAPGVAVFTKRGPLLLGSSTVTVLATSPTTCRVTWSEHVPLAGPLPGALTARLTAPVLGAMLRVVLRRAAGDLTAR